MLASGIRKDSTFPGIEGSTAATWVAVISVVIPWLVFVANAILLWGYIVDDAAISFAYSRSLAQGYGLVAQPGVPPVEGYSNFTWVLLFAPFFWLGTFDPYVTPKLVSMGLVLLSFASLGNMLSRYFRMGRVSIVLALTLVGVSTPFVVWTTAGLEGPLYVLLICLLLNVAARSSIGAPPGEGLRSRDAAAAGVVAVLIALTRPDGLVFAAAYPLCLLATMRGREVVRSVRAVGAQICKYGLSFASLFGLFIGFRLLYFGDVVPNTYHAKFGDAGGGLGTILDKAVSLSNGAAGALWWALLLGIAAALGYVAVRRLFDRRHLVLGLFAGLSLCIFVILPYDYMGEFRFGLPFFVMFYPCVVLLAGTVVGSIRPREERKRRALFAVVIFVLAWSMGNFVVRSKSYAGRGFMPMDVVARNDAYVLNDYVSRLGVEKGSALIPDVGAPLYYSKVRVYDLGKLTDRTIARTLGRNAPAFYDYVFETARPTFIRTDEIWTLLAKLDDDPRFRRDYTAVWEVMDVELKSAFGVSMYSGVYVRKDVVTGKEDILEQLREEHRQQAEMIEKGQAAGRR